MSLSTKKKIIYHHYHSGYRKKHSTLTILIKLQGYIERAMKIGEVTLSVFVDSSEAFDAIKFNILLQKLHSLHFSKNFLYLILNIFIRNGKIVWKHWSYCWYFRLNLQYLGWSYRAYIKTAKIVTFVRNCFVKMTLRQF